MHDGSTLGLLLLCVSVDESVEEVDEGVEVEIGGGGDGFVVEELGSVERDGGVEVGEEGDLRFEEGKDASV